MKFNICDIPRTGTGLVPTSCCQQMDAMSTTTQWSLLPPKPKPVMYPYQGDYINEQNRKILDAKERAKKEVSHLTVGYLDFISKKMDKPSISPSKNNETIGSVNRNVQSAETPLHKSEKSTKAKNEEASSKPKANFEKDNNSRFQEQIECIIERAAEIVIMERHKAESDMAPSTNASTHDSDRVTAKGDSPVMLETFA